MIYIDKIRKYCRKCGLTWFAKTKEEKCPDCQEAKREKEKTT